MGFGRSHGLGLLTPSAHAPGVPFGVDYPDPSTWGLGMVLLHSLGLVYLGAFVGFYFRLRSLEKAARKGGEAEAKRFDRALHGFPNAFFAKQFGLHGLRPR